MDTVSLYPIYDEEKEEFYEGCYDYDYDYDCDYDDHDDNDNEIDSDIIDRLYGLPHKYY